MRQFDSLPSMLENSTALYSQYLFDPIFTPIFTSILGTATIAGTSITYASVAAAIATTALSIGIQALLAPKPPKPEDGKVPLTQSVPYRTWCVGRNRLAGAYMLMEARGRYLCTVQALAAHHCHAINRYWLHDDEVELDADGYTTETRRYGKDVRLLHRLGSVPETAYSEVVSVFSDLGASAPWTSNHRGDGQTSVAMIATRTKEKFQAKTFPYGAPSVSCEVDGAYVFDYRISSDPSNPLAWVYSTNSALVMAWHQCFNEFGHKRNFATAILPVLDMWIEEANICDELVTLAAGGSERRYTCNGFDTTENDPKAATNAILASCDGWICERGDGALLFTVGKFRESRVATLTDADIVGRKVSYGVLFEDECNRLIPKFTYPAIGYATADTDFFEDSDAQLVAGRVLAQDANYQWVHSWTQARRLGKRDWLRTKEKVSGSIDVRLSGLNAVYARWIRLESPNMLPGLNGKVIENRRSILALLNGGFTIDFVKNPDAIDEWVPATDEGQRPPVPEKVNPDNVVTPTIENIQVIASSGSVYLRVTITDPNDDGLVPEVRYRVSDDGTGSPGDWVTQQFDNATPSSGKITVSTNTLPADRWIGVQVSFRDGNYYSDWTVEESRFTTADPVAPGLVTSVSVSTGVGTANLAWTAPNSSNYAGAKVYWNTVNDFSTASFLGPIEYGAPNTSDSATRSLTAGTRYGWITSINKSGVESDPVATDAFVVA